MGEVVQLPQPKSRALVPVTTESLPPPAPRRQPRRFHLAGPWVGYEKPRDGMWAIHGRTFTCGMPFRLQPKEG